MNVGIISVVESVCCLIHFVYKVKHAAKERILFAKVLKNTTKLLRDVRTNFDSHLVCILPEERTFIKGLLDQAEAILRTIRHVIHIKDDADDEKKRQPLMSLIKWLLVNRDVAGLQMVVLSQQSIALLLINFKLELNKKLQSYADRAGWSSPPQYSAMPENVPRYSGNQVIPFASGHVNLLIGKQTNAIPTCFHSRLDSKRTLSWRCLRTVSWFRTLLYGIIRMTILFTAGCLHL
jgi:hypothetical protein